MPDAPTSPAERRREVRNLIASGEVTSLRDLAGRLQDAGIATTPDLLRADVRSIGAIRVRHGDGTVLALPVEERAPGPSGTPTPTPRLAAEIAADPDWRIQVGVVVVVAAFVLVALVGWLISL